MHCSRVKNGKSCLFISPYTNILVQGISTQRNRKAYEKAEIQVLLN